MPWWGLVLIIFGSMSFGAFVGVFAIGLVSAGKDN